ncbi:MAG: type II secretion system protein [Sedimentisphaerales bacterium]|nr:type II secretion system protein [Sedimentisphaerales bacterium]MBN2843137.1 type II secretion system protein [Sedimentisphaerales bacterium]
MKKTIKAFTLIELLVVITIIALLVSILMPSLNKAKQQATMAVCLSGQKQLMAAYIMYTSDNNDSMVRPWTQNGKLGDWVNDPINAAGTVMGDPRISTPEDEKRGIEKGALWKYYKDHNLVHCPGDKRSFSAPLYTSLTSGLGGWRSYSIVGTLNNRNATGQNEKRFGLNSASSPDNVIAKFSRVKMPQEKYVFIEEGDHRGINMDQWLIQFDQTTYDRLIDSIGIYHNKKGTFSFADGHASVHDWQSKEIINWFTSYLVTRTPSGTPDYICKTDKPNVDIKWLIDHAPQAAVPNRR